MQKRFFFFLSLTLPDTSQRDERPPDFAERTFMALVRHPTAWK
jgi:hypothetical protein